MGEDASLDEFLDAGDSAGPERGDGKADAESEDSVEPAATTYAWSPDGEACAECGEVVERRWTQDDRLVCGACKSW